VLFRSVERFGLEANPSASSLMRVVKDSRKVSDADFSAFEEVLRQMQRAEAVMVAGGQLRVSRDAVAHAAAVIDRVLVSLDLKPAYAGFAPLPHGSVET